VLTAVEESSVFEAASGDAEATPVDPLRRSSRFKGVLLKAVLELFAGTPNIASTLSNRVAASLSWTTSAGDEFSKADCTEGEDNTGEPTLESV
jgi:hypothetical protein